jgi:AI-2 transport protein TqsA
MTHDGLFVRLYKPLLAVAALIIVFWALHAMAYVVTTMLLAFIITIVVAPALPHMQRRGLSHRLSLVILMVTICVVFLAFVLIVAFSVTDVLNDLPNYQKSLSSTLNSAFDGLTAHGLDLNRVTAGPDWQAASLIGVFGSFLLNLLGSLASAMIILLVLELFLLDADRVPVIVSERFVGHSVLTSFGHYSREVRSYFVNMSLVNLVIAGASMLLLFILDVPNPLLWALAIFILHFVPVIGIWLALVPIAFMTLVANGPQSALIAVVGIVLINGITSNTLYYRLMGTGLNLSPAAVFVSVLFWAFILGPLGALLALPLTLLVKMVILDDDAKMVSDIISYTYVSKPQSTPGL